MTDFEVCILTQNLVQAISTKLGKGAKGVFVKELDNLDFEVNGKLGQVL